MANFNFIEKTIISIKSEPSRLYFNVAKIFLLAALIFKLVAIYFSSATVDADSSITGLMGLHIMQGKSFPIFFYNQAYMGPFEAATAALFFKILGVSPSSLYLVSTFYWALFVIANYFLIKEVFGELKAILASFLLAIPTAFLSTVLSRAWGGYMLNLFLGTVLLTITVRTIKNFELRKENKRLFYLLGLLSGLALWNQFQILPYILTVWVLLTLKNRSVLFSKNFLCYLLLLVVGFLPVLIYNFFPSEVSHLLNFPQFGEERFMTFRFLFDDGRILKVRLVWAFEHLIKVLKISLPVLLGSQLTAGFYLIPTLSKLLLLFYAVALFYLFISEDKKFRSLLRLRLPERETFLKSYYIILAVIVIFGFVTSRFAYEFDQPRYLLPLYSVIPVLAAEFLVWIEGKNISLFIIIFSFLLVNHLYPEYGIHLDVPIFSKQSAKEATLVGQLEKLGIKRVYAGYWVSYPITFLTKEAIISSPKYGPYNLERYRWYTESVDKSPNPAYVFPRKASESERESETKFLSTLKESQAEYKFSQTKDFNIYYRLSYDIRNKLEVAK